MADEDFGLKDAFGSRLKSQFLGGLALSWLTLHWKLVYVTLFISGDNLPKEYVTKLDYIKALTDADYNQCFWWWLGKHVLPFFVAFFLPLGVHSLDKWIQHLKRRSSDRWANKAAKSNTREFIPFSIFLKEETRRKAMEDEVKDAKTAVDAAEDGTATNKLPKNSNSSRRKYLCWGSA
jgi:hypothetical protein